MAIKIRAHETFFIRKGWLSKGMKYVNGNEEVFISKIENPQDTLGLGSNMVKSLRYWMQATGLTEEPQSGKRVQHLTDFGKSVFKNDRYIEELGTLYLLQYKLASNQSLATSWYYFFNEFSMTEFTEDEFVAGLQAYVLMQGEQVSPKSMTDDFNCIIGTYVPRYKTKSSGKYDPESNIDCPFGELGLIDILNKEKRTYRKASPMANTFHPWVVLAVVMDQAGERNEIGLNELLTVPNNIGRIFNFDVIGMLDALHEAEKTGAVKIIRTAGLDIVRINEHYTFQDCVDHFYEEIKG